MCGQHSRQARCTCADDHKIAVDFLLLRSVHSVRRGREDYRILSASLTECILRGSQYSL